MYSHVQLNVDRLARGAVLVQGGLLLLLLPLVAHDADLGSRGGSTEGQRKLTFNRNKRKFAFLLGGVDFSMDSRVLSWMVPAAVADGGRAEVAGGGHGAEVVVVVGVSLAPAATAGGRLGQSSLSLLLSVGWQRFFEI
jgi:hypothetical protein